MEPDDSLYSSGGNPSQKEIPGGAPEPLSLPGRVRRSLFGPPRDLRDRSLFKRLSLIPFLAWVGLGADGLSSSSYGPDEAFRAMGQHTYLAVPLALAVAITIFVISFAYRHIIEKFPHGGGGYVVASHLLGERAGVVSGSALLVDYILTITVSIAAAGDALFSFLPLAWHSWKVPFEILVIIAMIIMNIRGVKESVLILAPIFVIFLLTHIALIVGTLVAYSWELPEVSSNVVTGFQSGLASLGGWGLFLLFIRAFSRGAGTYTGLEAVSNGLPIMREPQVETGKRTMLYMAVSLSFVAGGLLLGYLLVNTQPEVGKTMNAVLVERAAGDISWGVIPVGHLFVILTLIAEGALLVVAAQAGFIDGPRVMANMAVDSWLPRLFSSLSERLTTQNGILLMGVGSLAALLYTEGDVRTLVIMYSINVFVTFSLSQFAMGCHWLGLRKENRLWRRRVALFGVGFLLCAAILGLVVIEKFQEGGWLTLLITALFISFCFLIRAHYRAVRKGISRLDADLGQIPLTGKPPSTELDPEKPAAAVLVADYGGLGVHTVLAILRSFPGHFCNLLFLSAGIVDSGNFKGEGQISALEEKTRQALEKYVAFARGLGLPAAYSYSLGTDAVAELENLCQQVARQYPRVTFFAGQVIFQREAWYHRLLHNEIAFTVQKRLQWAGLTMVIMPVRVFSQKVAA